MTNARVLLVENIHPAAVEAFSAYGMADVERVAGAVDPADLMDRAAGVELLGIRSRTSVSAELLSNAANLLAVGCFCIGTNQVDLEDAARRGVPVFNAPFANARSVAELTIAASIVLMRGIPAKSSGMHAGRWSKSAKGSYEVRKKKLGIVGYGNIGSQLSVLASMLGMHVYYYDIEPKLAHGNARSVSSLDELLGLSDIVSLHVPSTPLTRGMINADALAKMRPGSVLINYARGDLVDIAALAEALESGRLAGAAVDVFPVEPKSAEGDFDSPLRGLPNALLSPHIGGSTQEAQEAIGLEVAAKLATYLIEGSTAKAVNVPEVIPPKLGPGITRFAHMHRNVPGVMTAISETMSGAGLNITSQLLGTTGEVGYAVTDVAGAPTPEVADRLRAIDGAIRVRVLTVPAA